MILQERTSRSFLLDLLEQTASQADLRGTAAVFVSLSSMDEPSRAQRHQANARVAYKGSGL